MQSYRHSHYGKDRVGVTLDEEWFTTVGAAGSTLRAGIWYEDSRRDLGRDWHQMLDPTLNFNWNEQAYWHQYEWDFPQRIFKWYVEETLYAGPFALNGGIKQFLVGVSREDLFNVDPELTVDSDSNLLFSGGMTYETPVEGLDLFAGYSENFKAISATLLEVPGRSLDLLEPETASNIDVGLQYAGDRVAVSATGYVIDFENRIFYLGPQTPAGPNYLIPGGGAYFNAGGIDTRGIELSATVQLPRQTSFYTAYTFNDSAYAGSGDPLVDANQGIVSGTDVTGVPEQLWVVSLDRSGPHRCGDWCSTLLDTYLDGLAGRNVTKPSQYAWNQGPQIQVSVSFCNHHHDCDRESSHVLLEREVPINRKKHVEVTLRQREQVAILLAGPTHFRDRSSRVPDQVPLQAFRQTLIKQNAHEREGRPSLAQERPPPAPDSRWGNL